MSVPAGGVAVMVATACTVALPASVALMVQVPGPVGTEVGAVKTHDVVPVHVGGKLPQVADQFVIGALAVNCCVRFTPVVAMDGVSPSGPIVTFVVAANEAELLSVAVMMAWVPVELAVKTHEMLAHALRKLPSPFAPQVTGAFAVKVWFWPSARLGLAGVMARGVTVIDAVAVAPEPSVAAANTVPSPPVAVAAAVKVLPPLNEPRLAGLTEYDTGTVEGAEAKGCVSPATTLAVGGLTSSAGVEETVIVTSVVMVVLLLASCACSARVWLPAASDVTV